MIFVLSCNAALCYRAPKTFESKATARRDGAIAPSSGPLRHNTRKVNLVSIDINPRTHITDVKSR